MTVDTIAVDLPQPHAPGRRFHPRQRRAGLLDVHTEHCQRLDLLLDGRPQPARPRPAPTDNAERKAQAMLVQRSLQPPPLPALRVAGGHVVPALARHLETCAFERGDDVGAALHDAVLERAGQVSPGINSARVGLVFHATKGSPAPVAGASLQRSQRPSDTLVDLNFKVPAEFRRCFKRLAVDADLKNVQLLRRAVEAYERARSEPTSGDSEAKV